MHEKLFCSNLRCEHNRNELCFARVVYYDKHCMTYKPDEPVGKMADLMQTFDAGCSKTQGGYKSNRTGKVLK